MKVYRDQDVIDAHETQVEYYLRKGWSLEPNEAKIPAPVSEVTEDETEEESEESEES